MIGPRGELTDASIEHLSGAEREQAELIVEAQHAYLGAYDALEYVCDPEGNTYDLSVMPEAVRLALAWTLAAAGYRPSGRALIKRRGPLWVDARLPDDPEENLSMADRSDDMELPLDTRLLAARRDGLPAAELPSWDGVKPVIKYIDEPR